jgi:hypothetical protein
MKRREKLLKKGYWNDKGWGFIEWAYIELNPGNQIKL